MSSPYTSSAMTSCSSRRKAGSPSSAKIAGIGLPALAAMTWSLSMNGMPSFAASRRPTVVLPAPMNPTRTITLSVQLGHDRAEGEDVRPEAEARDDPGRGSGDHGLMAEAFAGREVRDVHLDERRGPHLHGVHEGVGVVGKRAGVEHHGHGSV